MRLNRLLTMDRCSGTLLSPEVCPSYALHLPLHEQGCIAALYHKNSLSYLHYSRQVVVSASLRGRRTFTARTVETSRMLNPRIRQTMHREGARVAERGTRAVLTRRAVYGYDPFSM